MRDLGIEPGSVPWQGAMPPLNQPRCMIITLVSVVKCLQNDAFVNKGRTDDALWQLNKAQGQT